MHKDDSISLALRRIGRRNPQAQIQAVRSQHGACRCKPRHKLARKRVEALRCGEVKPIDIA